MIKKGIILAGGLGTRLSPITKSVSKQLLPVYDKPLIFYPLSVLMLCNIKNILIIVKKGEKKNFQSALGETKDLGINIEFKEQIIPTGIPEAFIIGEKFINRENVALILGDNFFYGQGLSEILKKNFNLRNGARIFTYPINDPRNFGIVEKTKQGGKARIVEKPKKSKSNLAITGLYLFDKNVSQYCKKIKMSKRKETEIVDLLKKYNKKNKLSAEFIGRGGAWLDAGSINDFYEASSFVSTIENRQGLKIACLEEIAFYNGWIGKKQIMSSIKFYGKCDYSDYLWNLIK